MQSTTEKDGRMTCVKTGAIVYSLDYGAWAVGDAYTVGDCFIFRLNKEGFQFTLEAGTRVTHSVKIPSDSFWRDDLGILVVPGKYVKSVGVNGSVHF